MNRYASLALALCAVTAVAACGDKASQDITAPVVGANVKFFNFGVGAPGVNFYAGTTKETAISSTSCQPPNDTTTVCRTNGTESTTGTGYGAAASGGLYNQVAPGTVTLTGNIAAATDKGLAISTVSSNLEAGKFYSYYVSGIYDATSKKADAFIVEDVMPATPDYTQAYVRFVNAVSNSQPMTLYANANALGGNVAYKSAGAFTPIAAGVYDLRVCSSCATANVATRTAVSFVGGHIYTVTARGDALSSVTANKPALDNTANR